MRSEVTLRVNGHAHPLTVAPHTVLLDCLREELGLRGTHASCDTAQCGACTVQVDGQAIKSCNVLVLQIKDRAVRTVEGLALGPDRLHPMQQAFSRHHALQCGFCTPGFLMRAVSLIDEPQTAETPIDPDWVRQALGGNLCRCTGYLGIVRAVCEGLADMRAAGIR